MPGEAGEDVDKHEAVLGPEAVYICTPVAAGAYRVAHH
jgi:hypothetical protein